jgi:hypothetical protein
MAIVTISRIQHRKGLFTDLPQLAGAELGWAVDEQRLFIGNGSLSEGAPNLGNTEILTEHSNLFGSLADYTYEGNIPSRTINTSEDGTVVSRSLQDRLDDLVSVRAFGVDGDDTECGEKLTWALKELYGRNFTQQSLVSIYIPAGEYDVSDSSVKVPPLTHIRGDGKGRTVLYSSSLVPVLTTVDTAGNSGAEMGTDLEIGSGETLPREIIIQGVTIQQTGGYHLVELLNTQDITFIDCEFRGTLTNITSSSMQVGVSVASSDIELSARARFHLCTFTQLGYAVDQADQLSGGMNFNQCTFVNLSRGIVTGEEGSDVTPDPIVITNCVFDSIAKEAIATYNDARVVSMGNIYLNCGELNSTRTAVMKFASNGNISWADYFDRPADDSVPRIEIVSGNSENTYLDPTDRFSWGHLDTLKTSEQELTNNASGSLENLEIDQSTNRHAVIRYRIVRNNTVQSGTLEVSVNSGASSLTDNYNYTGNTDAGVRFSVQSAGGFSTIRWQTTNTGNNATIVIAPMIFRDL